MRPLEIRAQLLFRADDDLGNGKRWVLVGPSDAAHTGIVLAKVTSMLNLIEFINETQQMPQIVVTVVSCLGALGSFRVKLERA